MKTKVITQKSGNETKSLPQMKKVENAQNSSIVEKIENLPTAVIKEAEAEEQTPTPQEVQKADVLNTIAQFVAPQPTAEEKIIKVKQFEALSDRYQKLKEKANDLRLFEAGNDQTNAKIVLINSAGFQFEVRNSNVIEKVQNSMQEELDKLLHIAQERVLKFTL